MSCWSRQGRTVRASLPLLWLVLTPSPSDSAPTASIARFSFVISSSCLHLCLSSCLLLSLVNLLFFPSPIHYSLYLHLSSNLLHSLIQLHLSLCDAPTTTQCYLKPQSLTFASVPAIIITGLSFVHLSDWSLLGFIARLRAA